MNWGEETVRYLRSFIGLPYQWGGNNPLTGFDCSGLISEGLKLSSLVKHHEDLSSAQLFNKFMPISIVSATPFKPGTLLFFGKAQRIEHVAMAATQYTMIESAGGHSGTTSPEIAAKFNAYVKERPWWYRSDFVVALYPPYPYPGPDGQIVRPASAKAENY